MKAAVALHVPKRFASSKLEYTILLVCHCVFIATDWCTKAQKWCDLGTPVERAQVQEQLEGLFIIVSNKLKDGDYAYLEVFLEMAMCLAVTTSTLVTTAALPQVTTLVWSSCMHAL